MRVRTRRAAGALAVLALLTASLTACSAPARAPVTDFTPHPGPLKVVSSVAVWADIAQSIGGSAVTSTAIISRTGQDPHSYEASVRDQLRVNQADITITNGADYDPFFAKLVASKPNPHTGMELVLARLINQHTPNPNPHLWYDLGYVSKIARFIGNTLALHAHTQRESREILGRLAAFQAKLAELQAAQRASVRSVIGKGVILTESFAQRLVKNLALVDQTPREFRNAVEADQDAPTATMETMHRLMQQHRVTGLILNRQTEGRQTTQLSQWAADSHIPVVQLGELLPEHTHYLQWMTTNLRQLTEALR